MQITFYFVAVAFEYHYVLVYLVLLLLQLVEAKGTTNVVLGRNQQQA
jgi:hypothetical protein